MISGSKSRATLKQIAKYCGVSHTTVSMVINQNPRISAETREKVMAAIKKFNSKVAATLGAHSDEDIFVRLLRIREGATADAGGPAGRWRAPSLPSRP